tara:strand:+ start:3638 stop:5986 length:2349 start_codon:yes stop_codon:yes gene_type:complete
MEYTQPDEKKFVEETQDLWKTYSNKRDTWATHAQEDREFRLGKQWTAEQRKVLEARGQAPIVVNRIHPAVEAAKAMLTSNRPSFRVSPREDSDNKVAQSLNGVIDYVWQQSDGDTVMRNVVDDYYTTGMGVALAYINPEADDGKGDVLVKDVDPLDVYIDPNSRDRMVDDAENIIISRLYTKAQALRMYPSYKQAIKNAESDQYTDRPVTTREDRGEAIFPEDIETKTQATFGVDDEYIRGYERYMKIRVRMLRTHERWSNREDVIEDSQIEAWYQKPAWLINGEPTTNEENAKAAHQKNTQQYQNQVQQLVDRQSVQMEMMKEELGVQLLEKEASMSEAVEMGDMIPERYEIELEKAKQATDAQIEQAEMQMQQQLQALQPPTIQEVSYADLVERGFIEVVEIQNQRIKQCVMMGNTYLYSRVLPTKHYPVVFFMNLHNRTPYPVSDVRMVKDMQEYINKTRSLIIAHATTSTNTKILVPTGSVDMREFEQKWAQPGVAIEVDMDQGAPQPVQPTPLPNELYANENNAKQDIDHQLGLYEMSMGNSSVAPQTYKATVSLDEFGQRKMKSKLMDIEAGLRRLAQVVIPFIQELYQAEKLIRIIQPNNAMSEYMINKRMFDDKSGEIKVLNDVTIGKYDVIVVTGSTLPSNRYAQLEMYMDAFKNGIIDRQEVLKKTEVFDIEGVMQRTDTIAQLQQQLQQSQEQIKELEGDLQTREREVYHAKQKAELEKFKGDLDKTSNKASASATVFEKRLDDATSQIASEVRRASKETKDTSSTGKNSN